MSVRRRGQLRFGEVATAGRGRNGALERVSALVDWGRIEPPLTPAALAAVLHEAAA